MERWEQGGNALDERGKRAKSAAANPEAGESLGTGAGREKCAQAQERQEFRGQTDMFPVTRG
jgi:hypothetical protein